ncbi:MAG TPA: HAMP domain-containing sensor histidine kinase [Solirubrobacterales bacterium]|jgi:signal transduction histidine kinase|nr:HAMP domain-containing sensor histidine kinase [Solirubrobacterales bacterium]
MSPSAIAERAIATPQRWPVRWRLAAVSAMLTLIILVGFAAVVGRLTANKLENDFRDDLRATASEIALKIELARASGSLDVQGLRPLMSEGDHFRVVDSTGRELDPVAPHSPDLGPPDPEEIRSVGPYEVATAEITTGQVGFPLFVQYAQNHEDVQTTIDRLWLFLAAGVFVGTVLAYLAGLAVAVRAMRPISSLTAAAREIASTGDPSGKMPTLTSDDEVAELGRTLEDMLRSLDQARSETEQAMKRQREFVADASHELRTPLTSILANLELLEASLEKVGPEEDRAAVDSALRSSHRMSRLVSDLLLLARADAGRVSARQECDLAEVTAGAIAEVRPVAGEHELVLETAEPVAVEGNPDELHRMVANLLENAVRHTPDGTRVTITVTREDGWARLDVCDDGPGIPPGMEEQVFGRFVRGTGPADRAAGDGTGLGLAIVEAVATSHGGEAEAGSSPHGGARFTVRLPALDVVHPRPAQVADQRPSAKPT